MNYTELVKKISMEIKLPVKMSRAALDLFVSEIRTELDSVGKSKVRDFGFFKAKLHKSREVRIPGKPEKKFKTSHFSVSFHPDKKMLKKVSRKIG